jgi:hypothetical protein
MSFKWRREVGSNTSSCLIKVPNPVEPEYPFKLRLTVFDLLSRDEREKKPEPDRQFRAHVDFAGSELFRLWAPTREQAIEQTEDGLRKVILSLLAIITEAS